MADVNRVMEGLTRQTDSGQIIMGAAIDSAFQGRLGLTVVVSRNTVRLPAAESGLAPESGHDDDTAPAPVKENRLEQAASSPIFCSRKSKPPSLPIGKTRVPHRDLSPPPLS